MNLPNVFQNKNIEVNNSPQELFYGNKMNVIKSNNKDIKALIKHLFQSQNYVYKLDVIIETENKNYDTAIIGETNNNLITIDNELIPIKSIIDIYEKKKS